MYIKRGRALSMVKEGRGGSKINGIQKRKIDGGRKPGVGQDGRC